MTAAWANANVRDQVVTPFTNAAARTSGIATPVAGMMSTLTSTAVGLYQYTTATTGWVGPWNLPWGVMGYVVTGAVDQTISSGSGGSADVTGLAQSSITFVANRRLRATWRLMMQITLNDGTCSSSLYKGAALVDLGSFINQVASTTWLHQAVAVDVTTAGAATYKINATGTPTTGSGITKATNSNKFGWFLLEDIGPSGEPA